MLVEVTDPRGTHQMQMRMFANYPSSHMAFPTLIQEISPKKGPYTLSLSEYPDNGSCGTGAQNSAMFCTTTDTNDTFKITLLDMP
jgi:hypothetical protein